MGYNGANRKADTNGKWGKEMNSHTITKKMQKLLNISDYKNGRVLSFILLKAIAACLITNSHYDTVYPISAIATGGLFGDILFFIVSGFVLCKPTEQKFLPWYWKRIKRIYPAVLIGVVFNLLTGARSMSGWNWFTAFIFPTVFVFVGSIVFLYIPLYFVNKISDKKTYIFTIAGVIVLYLICYVFVLDKSSYQMDNTKNAMILFPYFLGMLYGGYLRKFSLFPKEKWCTPVFWGLSIALFGVYICINYCIKGNSELYQYQILVPMVLLPAAELFTCAIYSLENVLTKIPHAVMSVINFIAALTLEIYLVQRPIILALDELPFPVNWILITASILVFAVALKALVNLLGMGIGHINNRRGERRENGNNTNQ
ncbi:MAG: acyltransferase [Clostridiales bacterium]|nr:acyltransferase [Clostridiales bacterium]